MILRGIIKISVFLHCKKIKLILMSLSDSLIVLRNKKNVSQQEVADFLGIDRKTYNSWENGTDVKDPFIPKLAEFFQVEICELFREKPKEIVFNQYNTDNKDGSLNNAIVIILSDKESVNQFVEVVKEKFVKK